MLEIKKVINDKYIFVNKERYFFLTKNKKRFVILDKCPHRGGPLSLGIICDDSIQCPWHDNRYKTHFLIKKSLAGVRVKDYFIVLESSSSGSS